MEIKELSQLRLSHSIYQPFSLTSCGRKFAVIGPENFCSILHPFYVTELSCHFSLKVEHLNVPKLRPSALYSEDVDIKRVYHKSTVLERQNITLDPVYASDFTDTPPEPKINAVCSPPSEVFSIPVIAVISNYGACEIRTRSYLKRAWDDTLVCINDLWPTVFDYKPPQNADFQQISNYLSDLQITSCCWSAAPSGKNTCGFYCCTASGWMLSLTVELNSARVNGKINTGLYKISSMKAFAIRGNNSTKVFLVVSDISGLIKLFVENGSNLAEIGTLWNRPDNMICQRFDIQVCYETGKIILVTSKAAHFLAFLLDFDGKLLDKCSRYLGGAQITGFSSCGSLEYLVVILTGNIELITITFYDQKLMLSTTNVPHNMDCNNYHILGMYQTSNKVAWIFSLYPSKFVDVKAKHLCLLSICVTNKENPLEILKNANMLNIEDYADCAEVIRTSILNNIQIGYYAQYNPEPVQISDCFLNRLRIRLIIVQSLLLYSRRKQKQKGELSEFEIQSITSTIKAILIFKRLNHLSDLKNLSEFQKLSGMCLRRALLHYLKEDCNQQFKNIRDILIPVIEPLIERTEKLFEGKREKCLYCGELIISETGMCAAEHKMKRCCISYVQIPLLSGNRYCKYCKEVSLEDENLLKEILTPNEKLQCALYNCPLVEVSKIVEE